MSQVWLGGIYLKEEGGYEIILRALNHYKRRLKTIGTSPELAGAPMFNQIVQQEAGKAWEASNRVIDKIKKSLNSPQSLMELQEDVPLIEKALVCYKADIEKAQKEDNEFYSKLITDMDAVKRDYPNIDEALDGLKKFA